MIIRPENAQDGPEILTLVTAAFKDAPHSDGTEGAILKALRADGALAVSLVAEEDGEIVGHVAFSAVKIEEQSLDWYGLGPVAVRPDLQRRGIGIALINSGLDRIKSIGAAGCVVLGDPAYYSRFGFEADSGLRFPGVPPEYFQHLIFIGDAPQGIVTYHPAFYGL